MMMLRLWMSNAALELEVHFLCQIEITKTLYNRLNKIIG